MLMPTSSLIMPMSIVVVVTTVMTAIMMGVWHWQQKQVLWGYKYDQDDDNGHKCVTFTDAKTHSQCHQHKNATIGDDVGNVNNHATIGEGDTLMTTLMWNVMTVIVLMMTMILMVISCSTNGIIAGSTGDGTGIVNVIVAADDGVVIMMFTSSAITNMTEMSAQSLSL